MRTIGIDNGTKCSAWAILSDGKLVDRGMLDLKQSDPIGFKMRSIYDYYYQLFATRSPDLIIVEDAFYNPLRPSAYGPLRESIGVIRLAAWNSIEFEVDKIQSTAVKKLFTGNGHASKIEVQKIVRLQYGITEKSMDICDAIAIAYAGYALIKRENMVRAIK